MVFHSYHFGMSSLDNRQAVHEIAFSPSPCGLKQQRSWQQCWCTLKRIYLKFFCLGTPIRQQRRHMQTLYYLYHFYTA